MKRYLIPCANTQKRLRSDSAYAQARTEPDQPVCLHCPTIAFPFCMYEFWGTYEVKRRNSGQFLQADWVVEVYIWLTLPFHLLSIQTLYACWNCIRFCDFKWNEFSLFTTHTVTLRTVHMTQRLCLKQPLMWMLSLMPFRILTALSILIYWWANTDIWSWPSWAQLFKASWA